MSIGTILRFHSSKFKMIAYPQRENGKIKAICRTSGESRGNGGEDWGGLGRCGWVGELGGAGWLARQHFQAQTLAASGSWRNASTLPDFVFGLSYPLTRIKDTENFANKTNIKLSTYSILSVKKERKNKTFKGSPSYLL